MHRIESVTIPVLYVTGLVLIELAGVHDDERVGRIGLSAFMSRSDFRSMTTLYVAFFSVNCLTRLVHVKHAQVHTRQQAGMCVEGQCSR